jgi:hypothetical protein
LCFHDSVSVSRRRVDRLTSRYKIRVQTDFVAAGFIHAAFLLTGHEALAVNVNDVSRLPARSYITITSWLLHMHRFPDV